MVTGDVGKGMAGVKEVEGYFNVIFVKGCWILGGLGGFILVRADLNWLEERVETVVNRDQQEIDSGRTPDRVCYGTWTMQRYAARLCDRLAGQLRGRECTERPAVVRAA